jgi:hypothetical protein
MKRIPILLILLLLAAVNLEELGKSHIKAMRDDGSLTNVVNTLVADGTFCQVRGHQWGTHMHITLEYSPNRVSCRQCQLCGLHQSQYATDWK